MLYRIRLDLAFVTLPHANTLKNLALTALANAVTINPGTATEEKGFIQAEKCYHNEDPTKPCDVLFYQETP